MTMTAGCLLVTNLAQAFEMTTVEGLLSKHEENDDTRETTKMEESASDEEEQQDRDATTSDPQQQPLAHEEEDADDLHLFPTLPAFTVPVEIRPTPRYGNDQCGVFALTDIPKHTKFWIWTHRVQQIHFTEMEDRIAERFESDDVRGIRQFLRQGFVVPPPYDDYWNSNPTDAGCYMNHSSLHPNCGPPHGTLRGIKAGEELTMDYSGNGNPSWYVALCHKYGILTGVEVAQSEKERGGGKIVPADYDPLQEDA
jgi:hypothetical protein